MDTLGANVLAWYCSQCSQYWRGSVATLVTVGAAVVITSRLRQMWRGKEPKPRLPPGPKGLPLLGNLHQVGSAPHRSITAMHKKYGSILFLRLGSVPTVVVDSPELIAEITKAQDSVFSSRPDMTFTKIVVYDAHDFAMAPYGAHWRHVRRICVNELLTPKRLKSTARERREESGLLVQAVLEASRKGEVIDLRDAFASVSMNVMCRMLLGRREFAPVGQAPGDFKHLVHEHFRLMGAITFREFVPVLGQFGDWQGFERDMHKLRKAYDDILDAIIQEHRDFASGKRAGGMPDDFITVLLQLPGENGAPHLDERTIKALLVDMMAGATDTSAVTNEWAMAEILRNPSIQMKLQAEIDSVVGLHRVVTESDLPHFPYLMCVVKETFRLHPAGPFAIPRESMEDTTVAGYHIPQGTRVLLNFYSLGRSERIWEASAEFRPERWAGEDLERIHDAALRIVPFGNGRRGCPGSLLGGTMVMGTLARLVHGFQWGWADGETAETLDMAESFGTTIPMRTRLRAVATPRLPGHVYAQAGEDRQHPNGEAELKDGLATGASGTKAHAQAHGQI